MKSILWILNGCGLEGHGITGGPVRFNEISSRFSGYGHTQHLLTTSGGRAMLRDLGCKLPMTVVPASILLKKEPCRPFRLWSYFLTSLTWRFWRHTIPQTDVIITVSDYFCDIIPAVALKKKWGAKWIAWIHHCETDPKSRPGLRIINEVTSRMQRWSFKRIAQNADFAWINDTIAGDEIERRLLKLGMPSQKIRRMKNGIDIKAITAAKEPIKKTYDAVMIGVRPNKGMHDIIPIWEKVIASRPGTTLMLMGGMSGETELVKNPNLRKLPITIFKPDNGGFLPASAYYSKIKEAKILFAPSHEEGWGIAVCEAMAAGLPVVAYDLPAYRHIYEDAYIRVPCFDKSSFATAINKVLNDPETFALLRRKGIETSSKYDWDTIALSDEQAL